MEVLEKWKKRDDYEEKGGSRRLDRNVSEMILGAWECSSPEN